MRTIRRFSALLCLILLLQTLSMHAFAAEVQFSDVTADSPWTEGIAYVSEQGISVGTGQGLFSPDAPITCRQWAVMLCRAFDKHTSETEEGVFGQAQVIAAYQEGWLSMNAMLMPDLTMCRGYLYESAFRAAGIPVYDYELYPDGQVMISTENCLRIGKELGLCAESAASTERMTRGEAAQLLFQILTTQFQIDAPPIAGELELVNRDEVHLNDFLKEIQKVPLSIRQQFKKQGWKYVIDSEYISNFSKEIGMSCIGACSYREKKIYVASSEATIHEFGHYLHGALRFPASFAALYEKEAEQGRPVLRDYAMTNVHEYFADYFKYWVQNQGNEEKMLVLKTLTPETYAYFSSLATNNWGLPVTVN